MQDLKPRCKLFSFESLDGGNIGKHINQPTANRREVYEKSLQIQIDCLQEYYKKNSIHQTPDAERVMEGAVLFDQLD